MSIPWRPHDYQKKALKFLLSHPEGGLLLDPGLGKTAITLAALKVLKMRALVIAPLRVVYEVWGPEAKKWKEFQKLKVAVLHGPKKQQALESDADIYCINHEGLPWLVPQWHDLEGRPDVLVCDESTKLKNTNTQRFKLLRKILGTFRRRIILTGTPVPNGLLDLFGQIYILDLGNALGRFVTHYRNEYFFTSGFGNYEWSLQRGATERIYEKVRPITLRLAAEDYLTMPKKTDVTVAGVLPEKARKDYDQLIDLYLIAREDDTDPVTVENAAALSMKLRQVTGGFVYTESGATRVIHTAKLEMLADLIETLSGQPTLVAYQFQHEAEAIREELGIPLFKGSPTQIRSWVQQWNAGSLPALLIHPDTAGHGLNLQTGGHHLIWYSLPWNQEHYDQTFRRLWRQGQEFPVTQHHLIMRETVDELVLKTLGSKERVQKLFLDAMRKEVRRGRKV